ncbi:hypothetical protein U0070_013522, partial [Myodes glareolus]
SHPVCQSCLDLDQLVQVVIGVCGSVVIEVMAGPESDAQFQFTGIKKYFNSYTLTGRMNVSINYIFKHLYLRIKEI